MVHPAIISPKTWIKHIVPEVKAIQNMHLWISVLASKDYLIIPISLKKVSEGAWWLCDMMVWLVATGYHDFHQNTILESCLIRMPFEYDVSLCGASLTSIASMDWVKIWESMTVSNSTASLQELMSELIISKKPVLPTKILHQIFWVDSRKEYWFIDEHRCKPHL